MLRNNGPVGLVDGCCEVDYAGQDFSKPQTLKRPSLGNGAWLL